MPTKKPPMLADVLHPGKTYRQICRDVLRMEGLERGSATLCEQTHRLMMISLTYEDDKKRQTEFFNFAEAAKAAIAAHRRAARRPRKTFRRHCNGADVIRAAALGIRLD